MSWKTTALIAALGLALAGVAAAKPAPKHAPPAAPAKPAAPAAAAKPVALDSTDPASLIELMNSVQAKATVAHKEEDSVLVAVSSVAANFSAQFVGCDAQGRKCKVVVFDDTGPTPSPSYVQLNDFNQASGLCRVYQDRTGKPHVVFSTLLFAEDSRERLTQQLGAWRGCIGDFLIFAKDPLGYLASAP